MMTRGDFYRHRVATTSLSAVRGGGKSNISSGVNGLNDLIELPIVRNPQKTLEVHSNIILSGVWSTNTLNF